MVWAMPGLAEETPEPVHVWVDSCATLPSTSLRFALAIELETAVVVHTARASSEVVPTRLEVTCADTGLGLALHQAEQPTLYRQVALPPDASVDLRVRLVSLALTELHRVGQSRRPMFTMDDMLPFVVGVHAVMVGVRQRLMAWSPTWSWLLAAETRTVVVQEVAPTSWRWRVAWHTRFAGDRPGVIMGGAVAMSYLLTPSWGLGADARLLGWRDDISEGVVSTFLPSLGVSGLWRVAWDIFAIELGVGGRLGLATWGAQASIEAEVNTLTFVWLSPSAMMRFEMALDERLSMVVGLDGGWVTKPVAARVADERVFMIQGPWLGLSMGGGWR